MRWRNRTPEVRELELRLDIIEMLRQQALERIAMFNVRTDPNIYNESLPINRELLAPIKDNAEKELARLYDEHKILELKIKAAQDAAGYGEDDE